MQILHGRPPILMNPRVVRIVNIVLFANLAHLGGNVWVIRRRHAWEQVMFHLKIKTSSECTRNKSAVGARCFHLGLEPANRFARSTSFLCWIAVSVNKIMGERKQYCQSQGFTDGHYCDVIHSSQGRMMLKRNYDIDVNVQKTQENGILAAVLDIIAFHSEANTLSTSLLEGKNFWVEDRRKPVPSKNKQVEKSLKRVERLPGRMVQRVIVEEHERLGSKRVWVFFCVVGVRVMRPMLLHPKPLASSNKVSSESQQIIDPRSLGGSSVISIMLNIQTDQSLRDSVYDSKSKRGSLCDPKILKGKEERNVANATEMPSVGSKFLSAADNLEDFALNFLFKWSVELVSVIVDDKRKVSP